MEIQLNSPHSIQKITETLKKHKIVIIKCDTIYGIIGKAPETFERICSIKGRNSDQAFLILIAAETEMANYTNTVLPETLRAYWPGPLTVIFPGKEAGSSVALRIPDDPVLLSIMQSGHLALYSTSVNCHGEKPLNRIHEIRAHFGNKVDLLVDAGDLPEGKPSTIIDIRCRPYKVVRQGSLRLPSELFIE